MQATWSAITLDCRDPERLARFWGTLLAMPESVPLPGWRRLHSPDGHGIVINLQPVDEAKRGKVRMHIDVTVAKIDEGISQVVALGGSATKERHQYVEGVVQVMTDPEGNEFCITQYFSDTS